MTEWQLFEPGTVPVVSTAAFHADRPRATHLEQPEHRPRLLKAEEYVLFAARHVLDCAASVSDLGCGDGGLLQLLDNHVIAGDLSSVWGYDLCPANVVGAVDRRAPVAYADVFNHLPSPRSATGMPVVVGEIAVLTEVLEHLRDPHGALRWLATRCHAVVVSSPATETDRSHDECHAWAWDEVGYERLLEDCGFDVVKQERIGRFQVALGWGWQW